MMKSLLCLLLVCLVTAASEKCYKSNCELYDILKDELDGYLGYSVAHWVCLARELTNACMKRTYLWKGSFYYGMFKIGAEWCEFRWGARKNWCGTTCENLLNDDLSGDITCLKYIIRNRGIKAWDMWNTGCKNGYVYSYIKGCDRK